MEKNSVLVRLRAERGMTQKELAEELHVTRQAISQWESGTTMPSMEKLLELSRIFEVPVDELYDSGPAQKTEVAPEVLSDRESVDERQWSTYRPRKMIIISFIAFCFCCGVLLWGKYTNSMLTAKVYLLFVLFLSIFGWFLHGVHLIFTYYKKG